MERKLVFATNNAHKLREVSDILAGHFTIVSLRDIGCDVDIPETADTLEGNALQKARFIQERYGLDCFADDTGLEVEALCGAPGVFSARYAGPGHDSEANMLKLLCEMEGRANRNAHFRTAIALLLDGKEYFFEGVVNGTLTRKRRGDAGFGYDPIFMPDSFDRTFAELGDTVKNAISHRSVAVRKLADFLSTYHSAL